MDNLEKWLEFERIVKSWEYEGIELDNSELELLLLDEEE